MATKQQKQEKVQKIKDLLTKAKMIVFCDYLGLTVREITTLRRKLQSSDGDYTVIKNTLTKIAAKDMQEITLDKYLTGPSALAVAYKDPSNIAKTLLDFIREVKKTSIKGILLEKKDIAIDTLKDIANLPSKEVLIAKLFGTLNAPVTNLAFALNGVSSKLVWTLEAIRKQKESITMSL